MSKTLVTFVLDRSGSMESIKDDTIGAFNAYIDTLKSGEGIEFSLVQFDSQGLEKTYVRQPIDKVGALTNETYQPRASTPLIDASYKTIKAVEQSLNGDGDTKVIICIQTDGHENCSIEHTWADLNALIKEKTALGWQFNFMGASIDAYDQGAKMGISAGSTISYDSHDWRATRATFAASASNAVNFAAGLSANTDYSHRQRAEAKDAFVPPPIKPAKPDKAKKAIAVDDFTL